MKWNKQSYKQILQLAIKQGYESVDFLNVNFAGEGKRQVILRHDIDTSPAVALEMAEIDASYSIKSTFSVLLSSPLYNLFTPANIKVINEIHGLGHNIALHHRVIPERSAEQIRQGIDKEMQIMSGFFPYIQPVFIWHNLPSNTFLSQIEIPNMVNAYSPKFTKKMHHISDSVIRHTPEEFLSTIGNYKLLHMLLHPLIWMAEKDNMVAMISHALTRIIRNCDEEFSGNRAWKEKFPNGIPEEILQRLEEWLVEPCSVTGSDRKDRR